MRYALLFLLFIVPEVKAQQVLPLFQNDSLKTIVTMPFRLRKSTTEGIPIVSIALVSGTEECKAMIDPNISSNFLVRCGSPASVSIDVFFESNGVLQKIRYGPLSVTQLSDSGVVAPPPVTVDRYKTGRDLFAAKCMECHQSPYEKQNKTFTQIKQSIQSVGEMNKLSILTDSQIQAIRDYLNHLD